MGELDALTELRAQFEKAENKKAAKVEKVENVEKVEKTEAPVEESKSISELKDLTGVGPAMVKRMAELNVNTIEDLLAITPEKAAELAEQDAKISTEQWSKWIQEAQG